ncbi:ABC transporter ATP-binding protein [Aurantimonas litoralis]|nr:ABC transporter ATP-binding protein [Aurantimonas litoralis]
MVDSITKQFKLYRRPMARFADYVRPKPGRFELVSALDDVSFTVSRGECFGIVGSNGSGKSTLLKLIAGTLVPTHGSIGVEGRVLALLELGGGINPELTGRQNIGVSATLLGFPEGYADARMEDIRKFAELGDYFDRPMRTYSSGMYVRLAFSIYLFMDPQVFIVDEALSVGDVFFQQKCYEALRDIMARGATVLFVSHDTGAVQKLCDRALLLERGKVQFIGLPDETVNRYHTNLGRQTQAKREKEAAALLATSGQAAFDRTGSESLLRGGPVISRGERLSLTGARVIGPEGEPLVVQDMRGDLRIQALIEARGQVERPDVRLTVHDRFGSLVFRSSPARQGAPLQALADGERMLVTLTLGCWIAAGQYTFTLGVNEDAEAAEDGWRDSAMLGPLFVVWDKQTSPFYGQLGLRSELVVAEPQ